MQKGQEKDFDLFVKSMLENAQEEVPSGVWSSVSAGLDRRRRRVLLKRWGIAAAAAAAVLFAVVLTRNNSTLHHINEDGAVAVSVEPAVPEAPAEFAPAPSEGPVQAFAQTFVDPAGKASVPERERKAAPAMPGYPDEEDTAVTDDVFPVSEEESLTVSGETVVSLDEAVSAAAEDVIPAEVPDGPDPFAALVAEEVEPRRLQLQASGDILGNGSPSSTAALARRYASGTVPTETTIAQTSKESTYSIPLSFGLGVRIPLSDRFSLGTGVSYSRLERTFTGNYIEVASGTVVRNISADIHNTLHYVGIPVYAYYNLLGSSKMNFYAYGGGMVEKAVGNRYRLTYAGDKFSLNKSVSGVQLSAAAGFGLEFKLAPALGFYLDPSLRYYFDCNQPASIRTQQPFTFGFEIGLRLDM